MRQSASLALNLFGRSAANPNRPLQPADAQYLLAFLQQTESAEYFYSAYVSICDALAGLDKGYYSWATVKLYYATFYCVSALLARNGICLYHKGTKPWYIEARQGSLPARARGNTHQAAGHLFSQIFPNSSLLQPIDNQPPLDWLRALREQENYLNTSFWEPLVPDHFAWVDGRGIATCINAYVADKNAQYAFDKDHAAIAFPIECLKHSFQSMSGNVPAFANQQVDFLRVCRRNCSAQALAGLILS